MHISMRKTGSLWLSFVLLICIILLTACQGVSTQKNVDGIRARVNTSQLASQEICVDSFIPHKLKFCQWLARPRNRSVPEQRFRTSSQ